MKFIEFLDRLVNIDHIIMITPDLEGTMDDSEDWNIYITLSNGEIITEPEISQEAMISRYNKIVTRFRGL